MMRRAASFVALLMGISLGLAPLALGQSVAYPDNPDYVDFRRSEQDTLEAMQNNPSRALTFRLLVAQRRLREAQLMAAKGKFQLVPGLLNDYQETVKSIEAFLETLPFGPGEAAGYYQTIESSRVHHGEVLKQLARRVPSELHPSIEASLASSQRLRLMPVGPSDGEAASPEGAGLTGRGEVSTYGPMAPVEPSVEGGQPERPLYPSGTTEKEYEQAPETSPGYAPEDTLGHRLRPSETHTRGTRRPDDTHPRPRAREPIRGGER